MLYRARSILPRLAAASALAVLLAGCAALPAPDVRQRVDALLPADLILLGEQHDADAHQQLQRAVVLDLAGRGQLSALALEMADQGRSTLGLPADASETQVRDALQWKQAGWPWERYGPVVMAAVRHAVPVHGANLPREAMRAAMGNTGLDAYLAPALLEQQREGIRAGHCALLPESQIAPMTRIQIARDAAMAQTLQAVYQPGKTAILVAGGGHVRRDIGVPTHLPTRFTTRVVLAVAGMPADSAGGTADTVWRTPSLPPKDYCAELKKQLGKG
jgi:uncharacterized iron-regulated protein